MNANKSWYDETCSSGKKSAEEYSDAEWSKKIKSEIEKGIKKGLKSKLAEGGAFGFPNHIQIDVNVTVDGKVELVGSGGIKLIGTDGLKIDTAGNITIDNTGTSHVVHCGDQNICVGGTVDVNTCGEIGNIIEGGYTVDHKDQKLLFGGRAVVEFEGTPELKVEGNSKIENWGTSYIEHIGGTCNSLNGEVFLGMDGGAEICHSGTIVNKVGGKVLTKQCCNDHTICGNIKFTVDANSLTEAMFNSLVGDIHGTINIPKINCELYSGNIPVVIDYVRGDVINSLKGSIDWISTTDPGVTGTIVIKVSSPNTASFVNFTITDGCILSNSCPSGTLTFETNQFVGATYSSVFTDVSIGSRSCPADFIALDSSYGTTPPTTIVGYLPVSVSGTITGPYEGTTEFVGSQPGDHVSGHLRWKKSHEKCCK